MIEQLFEDAEKISDKYDISQVDVIVEFTRIEHKELRAGKPYDYNVIRGKTEQHFKDKYNEKKRYKNDI